MPVPAQLIGTTTEPIDHEIDSRWLMAYAASIGSHEPCYLDTTRDGGVIAHPLFPVCVEWPVALAMRDLLGSAGLTRDEAARAVHYTHDLTIHRPARSGDRLRTTGTLASVVAHRSGALAIVELESFDDTGAPVATTTMGSLYRDTEIDGVPGDLRSITDSTGTRNRSASGAVEVEARLTQRVPISPVAAHVYTEGARIWNPIHTDPRTARRAGLPGIILHGTATLAMAVSAVVRHEADGRPERIGHIGARFVAIVPIPSEIEIRILDRRTVDGAGAADLVSFDVLGLDGRPVVSDGTASITSS